LKVRIARYHNIFGPEGTWRGGKEKAPAAICRKIAEAPEGGTVEVWGDGQQTRSFLFIDECVEGTRRLMDSSFEGPVNIGSDEMIKIQDLVRLVESISGKPIHIKNVDGPTGVRGRNSDNSLIMEKIGWKPTSLLRDGIEKTYEWIYSRVEESQRS
jgi:nucleoside-diphosphate-sugar epimerase